MFHTTHAASLPLGMCTLKLSSDCDTASRPCPVHLPRPGDLEVLRLLVHSHPSRAHSSSSGAESKWRCYKEACRTLCYVQHAIYMCLLLWHMLNTTGTS